MSPEELTTQHTSSLLLWSEPPLEQVLVRVCGKALSEEDVVTILSSCSILGGFILSPNQITNYSRPEPSLVVDSNSRPDQICPVFQEVEFAVDD